MKTVAITNHKGGVGKSGIAVCLAGALVERGLRVLVVDLDQQATSTEWLGLRSPGQLEEVDRHGRELLERVADAQPVESLAVDVRAGLSCVPCGSGFAAFERAVAGMLASERLLYRSLRELSPRWDFVLLDCPPSMGLVTVNALVAADLVLVPLEPKSASRTPLLTALRIARDVRACLNPHLELLGIVVSRVQPRLLHRQVEEWLRSTFGDQVFVSVIRENTHIGESHAFQVPVTSYATDSNGARDFRALADEFVSRCSQVCGDLNEASAYG